MEKALEKITEFVIIAAVVILIVYFIVQLRGFQDFILNLFG